MPALSFLICKMFLCLTSADCCHLQATDETAAAPLILPSECHSLYSYNWRLICNTDADISETLFHYLLSRLVNSPQKASHLPLLRSQTACFHVLQPCWKTEKELTHEGSSRNSDPQSTTTKHSLTLKGESADLFLLALRSLFFKLKPIRDPDQRTCHTWRPNLWKYGSECSGRCSDPSLPGHQHNNSSFYCSLSRQVAWENVTLNYRSIELKPPRFCWDFKSGKRQAACKMNSQLLVCHWELSG